MTGNTGNGVLVKDNCINSSLIVVTHVTSCMAKTEHDSCQAKRHRVKKSIEIKDKGTLNAIDLSVHTTE
jgi:hypothetical protein